MARVLAEQVFQEPLTDDRYRAFSKALDPCLEIRNGHWRRSSLALDKLRMICEFEAPDAEAVREAFTASGLAFERIWTANVYAIEDYPEMLAKLNAAVAGQGTAAAKSPRRVWSSFDVTTPRATPSR